MGLDLTFSAPKDFWAVFAGADPATRKALHWCVQARPETSPLVFGRRVAQLPILGVDSRSEGGGFYDFWHEAIVRFVIRAKCLGAYTKIMKSVGHAVYTTFDRYITFADDEFQNVLD